MGDGSLVLLPTPGHTPGSLSLLIRRRDMAAAAAGRRPHLRSCAAGAPSAPGVGDRGQLAPTTDQVLALKERMPGLVILPAHDPTAAQRLLES